MIKVLMVGVDQSTKGGMWSVVENYLQDEAFLQMVNLRYIATATNGNRFKKLARFGLGLARIGWNMIVNKPDVVHLHMSERGSVRRKSLIARLAKKRGCKVLIHMHGAEFQPWYDALDEDGQQNVRKCLDCADCVLILGEYWRAFIGSLLKDEAKIKVLYNAVRTPEENPYDPNAHNLLFLGEVGERKGAYDLLTALKRVDAQLPAETRLLMYGPNPDGDIEQRIERLGLGKRVQYCGWADAETKATAFSQTAVCVLPSYHEGLPMTLLEAMANGIPCIATDVAAIPEAVNEANGLLISAGNIDALSEAIQTLIANHKERQRKSEHAYQRVKEFFSLMVHKQALMQMYTELVNK